jgi:hypothetical protein
MRDLIDTIALMEKREVFPISKGREIMLYRNPSAREIMRALKAAPHQTLRGGYSDDLLVWNADDAPHRDLGNLGYPMIIGTSISGIEQETDWTCAATIYAAGCGCFVMGIGDHLESLADRFAGLKRIGMLAIKADRSRIFVRDEHA